MNGWMKRMERMEADEVKNKEDEKKVDPALSIRMIIVRYVFGEWCVMHLSVCVQTIENHVEWWTKSIEASVLIGRVKGLSESGERWWEQDGRDDEDERKGSSWKSKGAEGNRCETGQSVVGRAIKRWKTKTNTRDGTQIAPKLKWSTLLQVDRDKTVELNMHTGLNRNESLNQDEFDEKWIETRRYRVPPFDRQKRRMHANCWFRKM